MPVFARQQESTLVITVDGDYTSKELQRVGQNALVDPEITRPARVLVDMSGAAGLARKGVNELRETAGFFAAQAPNLHAVAILAPDDVSYGLMRMGEAFFSAQGTAAKVFRTREDALTWLAS